MFGRLKEGEPSALAARNGKKPWLSEAQILVRSYQGRVSQRICIVIYIYDLIYCMYIIMIITKKSNNNKNNNSNNNDYNDNIFLHIYICMCVLDLFI